MTKTKTNSLANHAGKSNFEKQSYSNFVLSPSLAIDKTEDNESSIIKTDSSSFDRENEDDDANAKRPISKSTGLRLSDYAKDNIIGIVLCAVFSALIILLFTMYSSANRELGEVSVKLDMYIKQIDQIQNKYDNYNEKINSVDKLLIEVKSDINHLKEGIQSIKNN